jgi:cyclic pyranopterin phosphate synthase
MAGSAIESAVYAFEGLLPEIESPPIAARRALDHAGLRISIEAWRSLSIDERSRLTLAGASERVDTDVVSGIARLASPPPQRVPTGADPDQGTPPEALSRALEPMRSIEPRRWGRLRALDRYALVHTYRRAMARSSFLILGEAFDAVMATVPAGSGDLERRLDRAPVARGISSPAPASGGYQAPGAYSSFDDAAPRERHEVVLKDRSEARTPAPPSVRPAPAPAPSPAPSISTHVNEAGAVHMVPVGEKAPTARRAVASGIVKMRADTAARLLRRDTPKGEVLATARVAGIMAAKRTPDLIPLCHGVALTGVTIDIEIDAPGARVIVTATADAHDRTGVEMEALVAVSVACLTIYDMLKGIDRELVIGEVKLLEKSGGRTGHYVRAGEGRA